jgi:hypothetical protein
VRTRARILAATASRFLGLGSSLDFEGRYGGAQRSLRARFMLQRQLRDIEGNRCRQKGRTSTGRTGSYDGANRRIMVTPVWGKGKSEHPRQARSTRTVLGENLKEGAISEQTGQGRGDAGNRDKQGVARALFLSENENRRRTRMNQEEARVTVKAKSQKPK